MQILVLFQYSFLNKRINPQFSQNLTADCIKMNSVNRILARLTLGAEFFKMTVCIHKQRIILFSKLLAE